MIDVLYCKLAVGTQFATMNPAGGNRLSDGASCLNDAEGGLARLRSRGVVERHRGTTIDTNDKVVIGGPARGQAPQTKGRERRKQELTNVSTGRSQERTNCSIGSEAASGRIETHARPSERVGARAHGASLVLMSPYEWKVLHLKHAGKQGIAQR
jgi:hypothetical protein